MKTRKPLLGLLTYSLHSASGSLALVLLVSLLVGIVALISGHELPLLQLFPLLGAGAAPYVVLMNSEGTPKWESYQIAMPIKRKDVASALYLNVFIASLLGIPIIGIVWAVGFVLNENMLAMILNSGGLSGVAFVYGVVFFTTTFLYPLGCTRFGQRSTQGLFLLSVMAATAATLGLSFIGNKIELSDAVLSLMIVGLAGIAFVISLFITRAIYAKIDF